MLETERAKLLVLEERLHQRVVGQDEAVDRGRERGPAEPQRPAGPDRPIGSFLFCGPTGVGKTELCKALAETLFDSDQAMVRLDMSEFMEKHTVSRSDRRAPGLRRLRGGWQADRSGPPPAVQRSFCSTRSRRPTATCSTSCCRCSTTAALTDNHGHTVDFTNTIIVMTSNVGSQLIQHIAAEGGTPEEMREGVEESLSAKFLPEFLNRIDETIVFHPLRREEVRRIVDLQIEALAALLARNELDLDVTEAARQEIANQGYDPAYGARPLKRVIQQQLQNPLATELLKRSEGAPAAGVRIDYSSDSFTFEL